MKVNKENTQGQKMCKHEFIKFVYLKKYVKKYLSKNNLNKKSGIFAYLNVFFCSLTFPGVILNTLLALRRIRQTHNLICSNLQLTNFLLESVGFTHFQRS